jgi:LacI family transcriptional regulator
MREASRQRLQPRAIYERLNEDNLLSVSTQVRADALASDHHDTHGRRRLIGVAMNLGPWTLMMESGQRRQHTFFDDVLFGIRARADAGNVDLLLLTGAASQISGEATHYADICCEHGAESVILGAFRPDEPELAELIASGFPTVAIDTQLFGPHATFVSSDNIGGGAAAVRHLAELGRRRIAYIGAWGPEPVNIDRRLGYESALGEFGLEQREEYVALGGWSHVRAHDATRRMLELAEPPDAIFCASDIMAVGAIKAIEEAGLRVPDDVAVVGFDDSNYATLSVPSLTSVQQDRIGLGTASVEALLRMLSVADSSPPTTVFPTKLITRESTVAKADLEQPTRIEAHTGPRIGAPASRLSVEALYRLLGEDIEREPKALGEASTEAMQQEWNPKKRRLIALITESSSDRNLRHAFLDELFYCIRAHAYAERIDLLVFTNFWTNSGVRLPPILELRDKYRANGLIVGSLPLEKDDPQLSALTDSDFPCVTFDVDLHSDRIAFVTSDNIGGGVKVTRHLIETGHRRIAYVNGLGSQKPSADRLFGYQSELLRSNLPRPEEYVVMASWLPNEAYKATQGFLTLPEPPDAIFCASDLMAIGAMTAIEDAGLRVPDDVAVVGFDDVDYASLVTPSLTTVHQNQQELAGGLVKAMLRLLDHPEEPPAVSVIPTELIVRESSGSEPAIRDGA